jgi:hypothetical protein
MVDRMLCDMAIIGGNCATSCGISVSMSVMFFSAAARLSLSLSTPSKTSNIDRIDQQMGMLKQCGSQ